VAKFAAGAVDTGGKFAADVVDSGGNISANFRKMGYSGAGGN
jgi:hypothetical protein